jgi:serine/threonine protein kinase
MERIMNRVDRTLIPTLGARRTYLDLQQFHPPQPVIEEDPYHHRITIYPAATSTHHVRIQTPVDGVPPAWLVRQGDDAPQAYALVHPPELSKDLSNPSRPPDWGRLFFAVVYPALGNDIFAVPMDRPQYVAIKRLSKSAIEHARLQGGGENPYKEMARMEELGDNVHVLRHVEFLEDQEYLYIITPKACTLGTLKDIIKWHRSDLLMEPHQVHALFCKMLRILVYLEEHGINHHDLSPDNFLFLTPDNLVVFDLALSDRMPIDPLTGQRTLIQPTARPFGTRAWMDPWVFQHTQPYDGVAMDLWAAALILYNLLTNEYIYRTPDPNGDILYRYFIHYQGLWSRNEHTIDLLHQYGARVEVDPDAHSVLRRLFELSTVNLNVSTPAMHLLKEMLLEDPAERFTLAQTIESNYVQMGQD